MERMILRRLRVTLSVLAAAASGACMSHTVRYSPERDDAAMAAIANTFAESGAGDLVLSLCEDVAASEGWRPGCRYQHVVQGGGRGLAHEEDVGGVGCGHCFFWVIAYVQGTVDGGPFAQPTAVRGSVNLRSGYDDDPYGFPYYLDLNCDGTDPCHLQGPLDAAGAIDLQVTVGTTSTTSQQMLARQAPAACP